MLIIAVNGRMTLKKAVVLIEQNPLPMKIYLMSALLALTSVFVYGQRFAVVDVSRILEAMPEYQQAQKELESLAAKWKQEINEKYDEVKSLYNKYQAEQVLLSEEERRRREEEIMQKEKEVMELKKQRFGPEGDLFRRRQELIQPLQDKIQKAVADYAEKRGYDAILDKSIAAGLIYVSPDLDKTKQIMAALGLKAKQ